MVDRYLSPIIINYCIKCDVNSRLKGEGLTKHFNILLKAGIIEYMKWGDCKSHRPVEQGTLVSVYLPWEAIQTNK